MKFSDGSYEKKPKDAKTVKQWLELGYKPKSESSITYYEMPFKPNGISKAYAYVREDEVEPFDETDKEMFSKVHPSAEERAKIKEEKSKKKKQIKELKH